MGHPCVTRPNRDEGVNNRSRQTARRAPRVASSSRKPEKRKRRTPLQFHTPTPTTFFRRPNTGAYTDTPWTSISAELYCVLLLHRYIIALVLLHLDSGAHHRKWSRQQLPAHLRRSLRLQHYHAFLADHPKRRYIGDAFYDRHYDTHSTFNPSGAPSLRTIDTIAHSSTAALSLNEQSIPPSPPNSAALLFASVNTVYIPASQGAPDTYISQSSPFDSRELHLRPLPPS